MGKFINLKVADIVHETSDAVSLYFSQGLLSKLKYKSGQFLTVSIEVGGKEHLRAYSLNTAMKVDAMPSITIKRVAGGIVSNHLLDTVKKGQKIKALKPRGNFIFEPDPSESRHLVLVGGGSGITPLISIAKCALNFEPNTTVSLVFCNRNEGSIIFNKSLDSLREKFARRFEVQHILSEPSDNWSGTKGKLTEDNIGGHIARFANWSKPRTSYYICGPEGLMHAAKNGLTKLGISESRIFLESFTASSLLIEGNNEVFEERTIQISNRGKTKSVTVPGDQSILDVALDEGINIPYSCCSGSCGTCMAKIKSGEIKMIGGNVLTDKEIEQGYILTCVGHPVTDDVIIEVE